MVSGNIICPYATNKIEIPQALSMNGNLSFSIIGEIVFGRP
jgi:hypothetical protein